MKQKLRKKHNTGIDCIEPRRVICQGCGKSFYPMNTSIRYCKSKCRRQNNKLDKYKLKELREMAS